MTDKKNYHAPQVRRLGTYQELTQAANAANADTPAGTPNSAFPVAS